MREYHWEEHGDDHAILYGPEAETVAAVITMEIGDPDLMDSRWKVMSGMYWSLNFPEENTSIPLKQMERRVMIKLGNELRSHLDCVSEDLVNIIGLLFEEENHA